jgi:Uncharacterised nucleotidyltransferase
MAMYHSVVPLVHAALAPHLDQRSSDAAQLERKHHQAVGDHLRVLADLARLAPILDRTGAAWAVVKGPVLAEAFYPRPELRSYDDLDVLVQPGQFGDVLDTLEANGARLLDVNWPLIRSSRRGELTLVLWHGTVLDLHWDLITEEALRRSFALQTDDLLAHRRVTTIGSIEIPTLGAGDTFVYVALHAVLAGGDRLSRLADLSAVLRHDGALSAADWERATSQRCDLATAIALSRVRHLIRDTRAAASLDAARHDWAWRRLMVGADRVRSPYMPRRAVSMRVLAQSTRDTFTASGLSAARSLVDGVVKPMVQRTNPWKGPPTATGRAGNPLWDAQGTAADRQAWLNELESTSRHPDGRR